jgi:hypothetical protein
MPAAPVQSEVLAVLAGNRGEESHFAAGLVLNAPIACSLGLPLEQAVFSPEKRPSTVAEKLRPVLDLFA